MSAKLTAAIEITMLGESIPGVFQSSLTIEQTKPRKRLRRAIDVISVVATGPFLSNDNNIFIMRTYLESSGKEINPEFSKSSAVSTASGTPIAGKSSAFEIEPKSQIVTYNPESSDAAEFIVLTNMSSTTQTYHIFISYPFYTDFPLDGEIGTLAIIEIPIRIHPQVFVNYIPEYLHFSMHGFISVFNQLDSKVFTCSLVGVYRDCLTMETKPGLDCIQFSHNLKVLEKQTRRFIVRNKVPFDIAWDAKINLVKTSANITAPTTKTSQKTQTEWSPYTLSTSRISLKGWETSFFDVHFQSHLNGEFEAVLKMEYFETENRSGRGKKPGPMPRFNLEPNFTFNATVGVLDLNLFQNCVMFGHVEFGTTATRIVTITNSAHVDGEFVFYATSREFSWPSVKHISANSKLDVPITFSPQTAKSYHEILYICFAGVTRNIPIHAECHERLPLKRFEFRLIIEVILGSSVILIRARRWILLAERMKMISLLLLHCLQNVHFYLLTLRDQERYRLIQA
jgi:hypothetical protein